MDWYLFPLKFVGINHCISRPWQTLKHSIIAKCVLTAYIATKTKQDVLRSPMNCAGQNPRRWLTQVYTAAASVQWRPWQCRWLSCVSANLYVEGLGPPMSNPRSHDRSSIHLSALDPSFSRTRNCHDWPNVPITPWFSYPNWDSFFGLTGKRLI